MDNGGLALNIQRQVPNRHTKGSSNPNYKRAEKDEIHSTTRPKRPRVNMEENFLFGNTDDIDGEDDLLEFDGIPTVTKPSSRPPSKPIGEVPVFVSSVKYRRVLRHVPTIPYVPITASSGERLYLRLLPDQNSISVEVKTIDARTAKIQPRTYRGILGVNFHDLRREAEQLKEGFHHLVDKLNVNGIKVTPKSESSDKDIMELELAELDQGLWGVQSTVTTGDGKPAIEKKPKAPTTLWVEKYKPKGYMDLLSEEGVNHDLLHWLKLWDNCVFGNDYLARFKEIKEKFAKLEEKEKEKLSWKKSLIEDDSYDELGRPKQKIVLLHGPPGLGKTTAAHIIAKHAGYNVVEMNASDDRSVDVFRRVLDSTTESRSEMFQDGRPNCLIVDEIDGSPTATVEVLVNLVSGKSKESGKSKKKKILRRPIICICNELFIPALKNLRQIALILQFHPIPVSSLVERIEHISLKEDLTLDHSILRCIAEKSDCDIRSCLSTMQFIKQKNGQVTHAMLKQLGTSDKSKGIFSVWEDIFFLPEGKKYYETTDPTKGDARFHNVLHAVQNFGDYEKLQSGVFENYLNAKFRDSYFETILKSLDWSIWFNEILGKINLLQNYSLYGFLPMYFVSNHFLCATRSRFSIQYPKNTVHTQISRFSANFKTQLAEIPPTIGRFLHLTDAILDLYPSLLSIIQPSTIRPIPSQLWSPTEKECLKNIVDIMLGYNLTYTQQRSLEGNYFYQLDPDIEELVRFPSEDISTHLQFPYTLKQIISREIGIEKMRQENPHELTSDKSNDDLRAAAPVPVPATESKPTAVMAAAIPNWKQPSHKASVNTIKPTVAVGKDFFGRPIVPKPITAVQAKLLAKKANASGIWYQYKEGYSNSVRKKLKVKDFL